MKKPNPTLPPAEEWDFRQVDPILLTNAAEYEYTRQSDKIRVLLVRWLDTPLQGKRVRQHILDACIKCQTETASGKLFGSIDPYFPKGIQTQIFEIGKKLMQKRTPDHHVYYEPDPFLYYEMFLQHRPDFPNPWTRMKIKGAYNENFKRVRLRPMEQEFEFILKRAEEWPKGWKDYLEMRRRISSDRYQLDIDFFADGQLSTIDEIVVDFEKWLRAEVKRTNKKMRIGRNAQVEQAAYPLKCLAALRLRRAGFTQKAAANALQPFENSSWIVPYFKNAPSWTRAIQFAEKKLAAFESGELNF
jgi:hypothetical protein